MPRKNSYITITDQFCGAGGSSQGARQLAEQLGGGLEVKLALNHWKLAIETHQHNFPDALGSCTTKDRHFTLQFSDVFEGNRNEKQSANAV